MTQRKTAKRNVAAGPALQTGLLARATPTTEKYASPRAQSRVWEVVVALSAAVTLIIVLIQWYDARWARESASLAVARASFERNSDGGATVSVWLALIDSGNRNLLVTQSRLDLRVPGAPNGQIDDQLPMRDQSEPTLVEPGKLAVLKLSRRLSAQDLSSAQLPASKDYGLTATDGRDHVIQLTGFVVVINPSGEYTAAQSRCIRVPFIGSTDLRLFPNPRPVSLIAFFRPGTTDPAPQKYPCDFPERE